MSSSTTAAPAPAPTSAPGESGRTAERRRSRLLGGVLVAALALGRVRALLIEPVVVPTDSMAPTIQPGDHLLVRHGLGVGDPEPGDVVLVDAPTGQLMVKRVVAVLVASR